MTTGTILYRPTALATPAAPPEAPRSISVNNLTIGWPAHLHWQSSSPLNAPSVRCIAGDHARTGLRTSCLINDDGYCVADGYLEVLVPVPPGVTGVKLFAHGQRLPTGLGSTAAGGMELRDATGTVLLGSVAITPAGSPVDVTSTEISVTPGDILRVRFLCAIAGAQCQVLVDEIGLQPTTSSDPFWLACAYLEPLGCLLENTASPGYDNPLFPRQDEYSHMDLVTRATDIRIAWFCSALIYLGTKSSATTVLIDDQALEPPFNATVDGGITFQQLTVPGSVAPRRVSIVSGAQVAGGFPAPNTDPWGQMICGVWVPLHTETAVTHKPLRVYAAAGDSKLEFHGDSAGRDTFPLYMRAHGFEFLPTVSVGGGAIIGMFGSTATVDACLPGAHRIVGARAPDAFVFHVGRNDRTPNLFGSDAGQADMVAACIDALHLLAPGMLIYVLSYSSEQGTVAGELDQVGSTDDNLRALVLALVSGTGADGHPRSAFCRAIDLARAWTPAEANPSNVPQFSNDGVHLAATGHQRQLTAHINTRWCWSPMQLGPAMLYLPGADGSLSGGTPGAVAASSGSGASTPTVTMGGTLALCAHIYMRVVAGGDQDHMVFDVSFWSGRMFTLRGLTKATCNAALAAVGLTITVGNGAYDNLMVYGSDPVNIATVKDRSGNGRNLAAVGTGWGLKPSSVAAGGAAALVSAAGSVQRVSGLSLADSTGFTWFALARMGNTTALQDLIGALTATSGITVYTSSTTAMGLLMGSGPGLQLTQIVDLSQPHAYVGVVQTGSGKAIFGADTQASEATGTMAGAAVTATSFTLGLDIVYSLAAAPGTEVAVFGVIPRPLTKSERLNLYAWLAWLKTARWTL